MVLSAREGPPVLYSLFDLTPTPLVMHEAFFVLSRPLPMLRRGHGLPEFG